LTARKLAARCGKCQASPVDPKTKTPKRGCPHTSWKDGVGGGVWWPMATSYLREDGNYLARTTEKMHFNREAKPGVSL